MKVLTNWYQLMVADRLKLEMSNSCLRHILAIETAVEWLSCEKLADAADIFMHSHFANGQPRMLGPGNFKQDS